MAGAQVQRNGGAIGVELCGRHDVGNQLVNRLVNFFLALAFEQAAGDADGHRQQRNQRQQGGVGQRRRAHRTAVAHKTFSDQHPKMREPFQPVEFVFRAESRSPVRILTRRENGLFAMTFRTLTEPARQVNRRRTNPLYRRRKIGRLAMGVRSSIG